MNQVYFGLGSNLGNKEENLNLAIKTMQKRIGELISVSAFYYSEPWGFSSVNGFVNNVAEFETNLDVYEILKITQDIERELGRANKSNGTYSDRIIDIDILFYNDLIVETEILTLPHPLAVERDFVMRPLCEIAPQYVHPKLKKKMIDLIKPA